MLLHMFLGKVMRPLPNNLQFLIVANTVQRSYKIDKNKLEILMFERIQLRRETVGTHPTDLNRNVTVQCEIRTRHRTVSTSVQL